MNFKKLLFLILSSLAALFIWVHLFTKNSIAGIIGYASLLIESIMLIVNALKKNRKTEDDRSSDLFQTDETDPE